MKMCIPTESDDYEKFTASSCFLYGNNYLKGGIFSPKR